MKKKHVDILVVTDARLVGGGNKSIAQEIVAHSAEGYTTGLLSLAGPARGGARPLDESLLSLLADGRLQMIRPDEPVDAELVIARGPSMFAVKQPITPRVRARKWLLIANAFHTDPQVSSMMYDPRAVAEQAAELFGHEWSWVPLSSVVRQKMVGADPKLDLSPLTWSNIINTRDWSIERPDRLTRPIRIGRHSRDAPGKWPTSKREIVGAYPASSDFDVSIMGGARTASGIIGRVPKNWRVFKFGALSARDFLRTIDIYPYYHHPAMHEAFGRAVLEAIATGAVAILPPYFEGIYSDAAIYGQASDVKDIAYRLADDPEYLSERREHAHAVIEHKFSYDSHVERIKDLIGRPRSRTEARGASMPRIRDLGVPKSGKPRVLFYTDNGHGLGHVTRLMAYAKRLDESLQPYFLTMSEAYHLVQEQGFPVEYFPSAKKMKFNSKQKPLWEEILNVRLRLMLDRVKPAVLVVDHVNPPEVLRAIRQDYPNVTFVWSRRGLWRQHRKPDGLRMADAFDYVLEPMDLAAAIDMGFTPRLSTDTLYVPPITLVERSELYSRAEARASLGLPTEGTCVLLNLSADTTDQLVDLMKRVRGVLRSYVPDGDMLTVFAPRHALHTTVFSGVEDVVMRPVYPVAKYANAFDAAVSTTGYNSFHELVHLGVPTVFVARATQTLDDQNRRASFAPVAGFGLSAESVDGLEFEDAVQKLMDVKGRRRMRAAALTAFPENGANDAARIIGRLARGKAPIEASPSNASVASCARHSPDGHSCTPYSGDLKADGS